MGKKDRLLSLIEEINAMDSKLNYDTVPEVEGKKTLTIKKTYENPGVDGVLYVFLKETKGTNYALDQQFAASRFMEYMGMGKNILTISPVFCKDSKGKRHWGCKQNAKYSENHLWMDKIIDNSGQPGDNYDLVYTPEAIRQMANISLMYAICGKEASTPINDINLVISDYDVKKRVVREHQIRKTTLRNTKIVTGVYLNDVTNFFSIMDLNKLKQADGDKPSFEDIDIPFLDADFVERILALDAKELIGISGGFLNRDDERLYFERLEYVKEKLRERKERDALLPPEAKTILKKEDWEKPENRNRLEALLQNQREQLFPQLFGDYALIEGASHNGIPLNHGKHADHIKEYEKKYEKMYVSLKKAVTGAKNKEEKVDILSKFGNTQAFSIDEMEFQIYLDVTDRVINETLNKDDIRFIVYKRNLLQMQIADLVNKKLNDPGFKVPDEYKGYKTEGKTPKEIEEAKDDNMKQYALYLVSKENKELYREALEFNSFSAGVISATGSYENGSMTVGLEDIAYYSKGLVKDITTQLTSEYGEDFVKGRKLGYDLVEKLSTYDTFPKDKSTEIKSTYIKEGQKSLVAYSKKYGALILDDRFDTLKRQLEIYGQLDDMAKAGDAAQVFDKVMEMRKSDDADVVEVAENYIADQKKKRERNENDQFAKDFLRLWGPEERKEQEQIPGLKDKGVRRVQPPVPQLLGEVKYSRRERTLENGYLQQRNEGEQQQKNALLQSPNVAKKIDGEAYRLSRITSLEKELATYQSRDTSGMTKKQKEDTQKEIARCTRQIEEHKTQIERIKRRKGLDEVLKITVSDKLFNQDPPEEFSPVVKGGELYPFNDLITGLTQGPSTCYYTAILLSLVKSGRDDFIKNTLVKEYSPTQAVVRLHDEDGLPLDIIVDKSRRINDNRPLWLIVLDKAIAVVLNKNGFDPQKRNADAHGAYYATNVDWEKWSKEGNVCKEGGVFYGDISEGAEEIGFKLIFGTEPLKLTTRPSQTQNEGNGQELLEFNGMTVYKNSHFNEGDIAIGRIKALLDAKKVVIASTCGNLKDIMSDNDLKATYPGIDPYLNNYFPALDTIKYDTQADLKNTHAYMIFGIDEDRRVVKMMDPYTSAEKEITFETFRHHFTDIRAGD
jgi:hypothetical protein